MSLNGYKKTMIFQTGKLRNNFYKLLIHTDEKPASETYPPYMHNTTTNLQNNLESQTSTTHPSPMALSTQLPVNPRRLAPSKHMCVRTPRAEMYI